MRNIILIYVGIIVVIMVVGISTLFLNFNNSVTIENQEPESYIGCGCGCCEFDKPLEEIATIECLYQSKDENIQDKIDQDQQLSPELCARAGCSFPVKYVYCD